MKWYFLNEEDLKKLGITNFSKFEESEPLAVWSKNDVEETISNYFFQNDIEVEQDVIEKIFLKLKERNEDIFDYSNVNERIDQEIESIYKELYEINLEDVFVKDNKAFFVCCYGDYYGCEVYEYNNGKIGEFLDFTNLEEHMFEGMEKINLSLREKIKSIDGLGHEQVLCFKDKKDINTRDFKQEILYDVLDFLTDEELEVLYKNKEVEPINGPYSYIGRIDNSTESSEPLKEDIIKNEIKIISAVIEEWTK